MNDKGDFDWSSVDINKLLPVWQVNRQVPGIYIYKKYDINKIRFEKHKN